MDEVKYPDKGLYCPANEAHQERRDRILAAFSDDAIFLHCPEHDWLRIELRRFGEKISLKGVSAIVQQVQPKKGDVGVKGQPKVIFKLSPLPVHGRGKFALKRRKWREGVK